MKTRTGSITTGEYQQYLQTGIEYNQFKSNMAGDILLNDNEKTKEYIRLNIARMKRIEKTYSISDPLAARVKSIHSKIYWLILTEHWCGDAAQTLPVFKKVADLSNGIIEMKLVYRDENAELMNAYLTGESRSIPKLIQLDSHFKVTGIWGPRPSEAQRLVKVLKSNPQTASTYGTSLHAWYTNDKQKSLEAEIIKLLDRAALFCPHCFN